MSQAEDLLNGLDNETTPTYQTTNETEPHIVIGEDRFITVPDELKKIAVQFDHNIETVTFDCPRYWDEHDMSEMAVYVNYMRPDGYIDSYPCTNVVVDETDETVMHFDWTIEAQATQVDGVLNFLVCVMKPGELTGDLINHWNSELCQDMTVSKGLEAHASILSNYSNVITQLLTRLNLINKIEPLQYVDDGNGNVEIKGIGFPGNIAHVYSNKMLYNVGDYCVYLGVLHKCITAVESPEEWDQAKWSITTISDEMKNCFIVVDDGKALVASAITDKKVPTDATATFEEMAANIRSIKLGQGDAQPENVDLGVTFTNDDGELLTGTSTAAADLADLQNEYTTLTEEKTALQESYDALETEKETLETEYSEYKQAIVSGLTNSGLNVTDETSAEELLATLTKTYPQEVVIYANGVLAEGITAEGFTSTEGSLHADASADVQSSASFACSVNGIDVTSNNEIRITMLLNKHVRNGDRELYYGVDEADILEITQDGYYENKVIVVDVAALTGVHNLMFSARVENDSSDTSYAAHVNITISEIKLT